MSEGPVRRGARGLLPILLVTLLALLAPGCRVMEEGTDDVAPPVDAGPSRTKPAKPSGRRPGVVNIETEQTLNGTRAAGTGIVLTPAGLVLTNNHVIQGATAIKGTDTDNRRTYTAQVVGYDRTGDIAVISLTGATRLKAARFASASSVHVGDAVTAVGNAGGKGGTPTVVTGEVTALDQSVTARDDSNGTSERLTGLIETSAPIKPGDSGGPLLDSTGKVIGINTAASAGFSVKGAERKKDHRGYAIPSDRALEIARQIQRGEASSTVHIGRTAMLGVKVRSNGGSPGALVTELVPGSPAATAGIPVGAAIVTLGGSAVDTPAALTALMLSHHPGRSSASNGRRATAAGRGRPSAWRKARRSRTGYRATVERSNDHEDVAL
ncbi:S1C family serine protease [Actinomadura madurae]|uniref:S1C family serine protease n=1 Tax=Actinomadura madurae TaxID=1993 RepID=UPI0020D24D59|nr:trypsin-like peptidase domain-containing protein [Actinomadura madurae]MCP9965568.1 S1C family serine protease [Actinomadura madurae]MCQ0014243.1 S1C family serine protease [Actinomadura madurae]